MVVVVLALIALAVTATVVIRDAHAPHSQPAVPSPEPLSDPASGRDPVEAPTEAIDMTQLITDAPGGDDLSSDPPTQSMPIPVSSSVAQAAAILPYPASVAEPIALPAAFVPAGKPRLSADPDRLIQTEIVIEDVARAQTVALRRLAIGMAASGAVIGLGVIGVARGIALLVHTLAG